MRFNNRWLLLFHSALTCRVRLADDSTESAATAEPTTAAQEDTSAEPAAESDEPDTDSADAETTEMTPLKVVILPFISFAPYYIGRGRRLFCRPGSRCRIGQYDRAARHRAGACQRTGRRRFRTGIRRCAERYRTRW